MRPSLRARVAARPIRLARFALIAAITAALAGCAGEAPEAVATPATDASAPSAPATPGPGVDDLAARTERAIADNRLYAPAGDNAIEYYLTQRERDTEHSSTADAALIELQPYAMIAAEQAVSTGDLAEAERLVALMTRIDAAAPSLARLRGDIEAAQQAQTAADAREAAEAAEAAARIASAEITAASTAAASPRAAPATSAPPPAAPPSPPARRPPPPTTAPAPLAATREPTSAAAAPGPLVAVSTPFPPFPSEAIARGRSMGSVTVRFTVRANGRVGDARVVAARPEGLFERTVIETLGEWRFEPTGRDQVQTRTFDFRN